MSLTFYELLDVAPMADLDAIQAAYRRQMRLYHPDKVNELGDDLRALADTRAKEINAAFDTLRDPAARRSYDAWLQAEAAPSALPRPSEPPPRAEPATPPRAAPVGMSVRLRVVYGRLLADPVAFGFFIGVVGFLLVQAVLHVAQKAAPLGSDVLSVMFHISLAVATVATYYGFFLMAVGMVLALDDRPKLWGIIRFGLYLARRFVGGVAGAMLFVAVSMICSAYLQHLGTVGGNAYGWNFLIISTFCVPLGLFGVSMAGFSPRRIRKALLFLHPLVSAPLP